MVGYGQSYFNNNMMNRTNAKAAHCKTNCDVKARTEVQLPDTPTTPVVNPDLTGAFIKVPIVLAETTLQVVVEADIPLDPPACEIKRVLKDIFLTQCKLVPVGPFTEIDDTGFFTSAGAKLFVEGYIRKNIEYAPKGCNSALRTMTAKVPFSGFADLTGDLLNLPIFGFGDQRRAQFLDPKHGESPRLDKYFFQNSVIYNEQPYCELIGAEFFELDFDPHSFDSHAPKSKCAANGSFSRLREKIVTDLTLKVLQVQQIPFTVNGIAANNSKEEDC